MSLDKETSCEAFSPISMEVNSPEAGTEGFRKEGADQNEDISKELMEFLELEPGLEIPWAEIDAASRELDLIFPLEKESPEAENDGLLMLLEEVEQNNLFQEINQFLDLEEVFQSPCAETMSNEKDPTLGPSSGEDKHSNLKKNIDREKEEILEAQQRKSSAPSKSGSNNTKREYHRGKCCECNKVYLHISSHNKNKHNGELEKCTASDRVCMEYFASVQKRIEHEQQEHQERKKFSCQLCHYSSEFKTNLTRHVRLKHSDPTPGPSSDDNREENNDLAKKENQEVEEERKCSAPSKTGSNNIKKQDKRGKCCECNKVYIQICDHSRYKHNGKLEKCTATDRVCKEYFASAQKRIKHEQQEHQGRKRFCCQFCHYSTELKGDLNKHVRVKHSEKKIRCGQQNCGKMFGFEAELKRHVKCYHKMKKCPKCGREMSLGSFYLHIRYGRCRVPTAE